MRRMYWSAFLVLAFAGLSLQAQTIAVGSDFPLERLTRENTRADATVVAFIPSLSKECLYASMLTQGFYYYFDEGLAFERRETAPKIKMIIVVNDRPLPAGPSLNQLGKMSVIYDEKGDLFRSFGAKIPSGKNGDSTVVVLDKKGKVVFVDTEYHAQGEHLKPLEHKIKEITGFRVVVPSNRTTALKVGDNAADFQINYKERLSDLRGGVVLLTFYPAAFSGVFPASLEVIGSEGSYFIIDRSEAMSCSRQITSLDIAGDGSHKPPRRTAISGSTDELLQQWKLALLTTNIEYANDPDYAVAAMYGAIDPRGFNRRVSVIVDKQGRVAYIDTDYTFEDTDVIEKKIEELDKK